MLNPEGLGLTIRKRPSSEALTSTVAKKAYSNTTQAECLDATETLCESCNEIDFLAFFTSTPPVPSRLKCFPYSTHCPFCTFVRGVAKQIGEVEQNEWQKYKWVLKQGTLPAVEYLRTTDIQKVYLLVVVICPPKAKQIPLCSLELVDDQSPLRENIGSLRMVRRPLGPSVGPELLLSWLQLDNGTPTVQAYRAVELANEGFDHLISQGRMRVIDVSSNQIVSLSKHERYVALSYVWGRSMAHYAAIVPSLGASLLSTQGNQQRIAWDIDIEKVPQTIRDSIELVKQLRERYLWVDAFCINQADSQDKTAIIAHMDTIYSKAYFTLIAANGDDASAGLFRLKHRPTAAESPLQVKQKGRTFSLLPIKAGLERTLELSKWSTRAWTLQEYALSSRSVVFTDNEVFFSSLAGERREAYTLENQSSKVVRKNRALTNGKRRPMQLSITGVGSHDAVTWTSYRRVVHMYTKKSLSHDGDRLDAFIGIMKTLDWTYQSGEALQCSGLGYFERLEDFPRSYLFTRGLLWRSVRPLNERLTRIRHNATNTRILPSWSWTGWTGEVSLARTDSFASNLHAVLLDSNNIQCELNVHESGEHKEAIWPFRPVPCTPADGSVVLHSWLRILRCGLELHRGNAAGALSSTIWETYGIVLTSKSGHRWSVGTIDLELDVVASCAGNGLSDFVFFGWRRLTNLMLVQRRGEFFERVAISNADKSTDPETIDLSEAHLHEYISSLPYQHIKMI